MDKSKKDFLGWARVAEGIERRVGIEPVKTGIIRWCNFGVGIGTELYGKGKEFTRLGLLLTRLTNDLVLVIPITSQVRTGSNYEPIVVKGRTEYLNLTQTRPISARRIGGLIDEVDHLTFLSLKKRYLRFIKYQLYKQKDSSAQGRDYLVI